ncbi:chorismate mutase [Bacillus sp. AGMB 02131]|uniref:chorismate mutase n=1 Tax=Peribacillus faecalis TaxID=2772559 RepID=A0A927D0H2_9BACI|nr:chorismate mutase [Peribacillus faecalis]MBD3110396.1 chorismate mutase [Peribacillus faecalis]
MTRGVRGATTVAENDEKLIIDATEELLREIIECNNIEPETVGSAIISVTDDITATFPAKALRKVEGWKYVPVMCFQEIPVPGALEKCVRIMLHWNTDKSQQDIKHVYLKGAKVLRPDLNR